MHDVPTRMHFRTYVPHLDYVPHFVPHFEERHAGAV